MAGPTWQDHASHAVRHFAAGTTARVLRASDPARAGIKVSAVFPSMTFDERMSLPGGTIKIGLAIKDLGTMPLDGASIIELEGGRQYRFAPASGDGAPTPAALPGDSQAYVVGFIQAGGGR